MAKVLKSRTTIDFFYLLTSSLLGQGLRMVRSFIVAGIIGPLMFGTIQGLGIFLLYVPLIQLGYFQSMSRELPKRLQAGDRDTVRRINNNGLFMAILAGLIGLLVYMAIFAVQGPSMSGPSRIAWLLFAGMVALGPVTLFYQMIYSAYGKFVTVSKIKIVYSVVFFLLLGLVLVWGYVGQLLSLVLAAVLLVALYAIFHRITFRVRRIDFAHIAGMIKAGLPILASTTAFNLFFTIDRLFIIGFKGAEAYGYYALGVVLFQVAMLVPESIRQIAYRRFNMEFGKDAQETRLRVVFWRAFLLVSVVMWTLSVMAYHLAPLFIAWFLPAYTPGLPIVKVFSIVMTFTASGLLVSNALYAIYRQKQVLLTYLIAILVFIGGAAVVITCDLPTYAVALAMGVSHLLAWGVLLTMVIRSAEYKVPTAWLAKAGALYLGLALVSLAVTVGVEGSGLVLSLPVSGMAIAFYLLFITATGLIFRRSLMRIIYEVPSTNR